MNKQEIFDQKYLPYVITWGRRTNWTAVALCFLPALVLYFVFDIMPPVSAIFTAFVAIAGAVGAVWIVEPISYFPIIGVSGTYMAFMSGNIGNLRIPCAMVAQKVADVEPGTSEGSIIATLGIAVSILVNIIILTGGILAGAQVLAKLPPSVTSSLNYLLPALFGAIFTQFAISKMKLAPVVLGVCILLLWGVKAGVVPATLSTLLAVIISVSISIFMYKKGLIK